MSEDSRLPRGINPGGLAILLGLLVLLLAPVVVRSVYEHYHDRIDDHAEVARDQISLALETAHEARIQALLDEIVDSHESAAERRRAQAQYGALLSLWHAETRDDRRVDFGSALALSDWREGRARVDAWLRQYGTRYLRSSRPLDEQTYRRGDALFADGVARLRRARAAAMAYEDTLRAGSREAMRVATWATVAMAFLCLVLALVEMNNLARLRRALRREAEIAGRLTVAVRETNHRVKNNLQIVGGLVDMRLHGAGETVPREALEDISRQLRTVAAVHDLLTHELQSDTVDAGQIVGRLASLAGSSSGLAIDVQADRAAVTARQATALALVTNELLLNAAKHGAACAHVRLRASDGRASLDVADDGPGFPPGFDAGRDANTGLALVQALAHFDLAGQARFENRAGAAVEVEFPLDGAAPAAALADPAAAG